MLDLRTARYDHPDAVALTEQAQRYYVEVYGGPDDDPLTAESFAPPRGGFLLGYVGTAPVAMGGWFFGAEGRAYLRRMFVAPTHRRLGYGRRLLAALEADATAAGATELVLATGRPQAEAIALYRAAGYADVRPFGHYAGSDQAVHLGKRLTG
jgi:ribosomal protein S18 acetylase RimI-like enzyme